MPNFSDNFIHGSINYKKSVVEDHAKKSNNPNHPHTVAYKLYLGASDMSLQAGSQKLAKSGDQFITDVVSSFKNFSPEMYEHFNKEFQTTHFTAKNELPFSACKNILKLESFHGVDIGNKYLNDTSLGSFIDYISKDLKSKLSRKLKEANFL